MSPSGARQRDDGLASIRNVGVIAHIDAGKTTTTERFLFHSGATHRVGEVDEGNTVMDYLDEECRRGITIVAATATFPWTVTSDGGSREEHTIHLMDTPGHIDFTAEVERSLRVIDGAVVIFSAVEGVEAQSEKVWRQSDRYNVPKVAFVNKLDRLGASFDNVVREMREKFSEVSVCPVQIPVGEEGGLRGVVDLFSMKVLRFSGEHGSEVVREEIPDSLMERAKTARSELVEALADYSDELAEAYIEGREVAEGVVIREMRDATLACRVVPVFAGSAKRDIGVQPLLDGVVRFLPSPSERGACDGIDPKTGEPVTVDPRDDAFRGLVFKLLAGGGADLLYTRTYSGNLKPGDTLLNPRTGARVRVKRILRLRSKSVTSIDRVGPGDIVGVVGPSGVVTGDTLCSVGAPVLLEKITFSEPVISMALEPKSSKDRSRLDSVLEIMCREDPTLRVRIHESTGQRLLSGMGELHLEISCHRISEEFNVDVKFGVPQVAFRETIPVATSEIGVFSKTVKERELFAEVSLDLTPVPKQEPGIVAEISASSDVPKEWREAAVSALEGSLNTGGNYGYPLIYIKGKVRDIKGDPERTSGAAVAGAVMESVRGALSKGTVLLEPLMKLEITAPEEVVGEITGYLQARRAVIHGISHAAGVKRLSCEVPLAEMFGFSKALPKLSGGRAFFSMEPCGYQEISTEDVQMLASRKRNVGFQ